MGTPVTGAWYTGALNGDPALPDAYEIRVTALNLDLSDGPDCNVFIEGQLWYDDGVLQSGATLPTAWTTIVAQQIVALGVGTSNVYHNVIVSATVEIRKVSDPTCTVTKTVNLDLSKGTPP